MGITVTGYVDAPAERAEEVAAAFDEHMRLSLLEPGCVSYEMWQDSNVLGRFHVRERYKDAEALEAHKTRGAASNWARVSAGLPRNLQFLED